MASGARKPFWPLRINHGQPFVAVYPYYHRKERCANDGALPKSYF